MRSPLLIGTLLLMQTLPDALPRDARAASATVTASFANPRCATVFAELHDVIVQRTQHLPLAPALRNKIQDAADTLARALPARPEAPVRFDERLWSETQTLQRELDSRRAALVQARAERRKLRESLASARATDPRERGPIAAALRSRKINSDRLVERLGTEIDALRRAIIPLRERAGVGVFNTAGVEAAREANAIIAVRRVHPAAAAHMTDRAVAKTIDFKFNSAEDGVIAGLVPYDQSLSRKVKSGGPELIAKRQREVEEAISRGLVEPVEYRIGTLVAVREGDSVVFRDEFRDQVQRDRVVRILVDRKPSEQAEPVQVLRAAGQEEGILSSDIDSVFFLFADKNPGTVRTSPRMGTLADRERETIADFNARVRAHLGVGRTQRRYMTHGPEAHNPASEGVTGSFTVYLPDGRIESIQEGPPGEPDKYLKEFYYRARERGYDGAVHPNWKW